MQISSGQISGNSAQLQQLCFATDGQVLPPNAQIGFVQREGKMVPLIIMPQPTRGNSKNLTAFPLVSPVAMTSTGYMEQLQPQQLQQFQQQQQLQQHLQHQQQQLQQQLQQQQQHQQQLQQQQRKVREQKVKPEVVSTSSTETVNSEGEGNMRTALMQLCAKNNWKVEICDDMKKKEKGEETSQKVQQVQLQQVQLQQAQLQQAQLQQAQLQQAQLQQAQLQQAQLQQAHFDNEYIRQVAQEQLQAQHAATSAAVVGQPRTKPTPQQQSVRPLNPVVASPPQVNKVSPTSTKTDEAGKLGRSLMELCARNRWNVEVVPKNLEPEQPQDVEKSTQVFPQKTFPQAPATTPLNISSRHVAPVVIQQKSLRQQQQQHKQNTTSPTVFLPQTSLQAPFLNSTLLPPPPPPTFMPQQNLLPTCFPEDQLSHMMQPSKISPISPSTAISNFTQQPQQMKSSKSQTQRHAVLAAHKKPSEFQEHLDALKQQQLLKAAENTMPNSNGSNSSFSQSTMSMSALASMLAPHVTPPPNLPQDNRASLYSMNAFQQFNESMGEMAPLSYGMSSTNQGSLSDSFKEEVTKMLSSAQGNYFDVGQSISGEDVPMSSQNGFVMAESGNFRPEYHETTEPAATEDISNPANSNPTTPLDEATQADIFKTRKELFGVCMDGAPVKEVKEVKEAKDAQTPKDEFTFTPTRGKYKGVVALRGIGVHQCSLPNVKNAFPVGRGKPITV